MTVMDAIGNLDPLPGVTAKKAQKPFPVGSGNVAVPVDNKR